MKWRVYGTATMLCSMVVDANSAAEAIETANEEFGGLTNYAGMGRCDCLVGVLDSDNERCVYPDAECEFDEAEALE